jgi:hypothetical protein
MVETLIAVPPAWPLVNDKAQIPSEPGTVWTVMSVDFDKDGVLGWSAYIVTERMNLDYTTYREYRRVRV